MAGFSIVSTVHGGWVVQSTAIPGGCTRTAYRRGFVSWQGISPDRVPGTSVRVNSAKPSLTDFPGKSDGRRDSGGRRRGARREGDGRRRAEADRRAGPGGGGGAGGGPPARGRPGPRA